MTAADYDLAADSLDRQIRRATEDGYLEDALSLASDSLSLRIDAVEQEPVRFRGLSDTLDLTARAVYESMVSGSPLPEPTILRKAAECYYKAAIFFIPADGRLDFAEQITSVAEGLVRAHRFTESLAASKAAASIFQDMFQEKIDVCLPGLVRVVSVRCAVHARQKDADALGRLLAKRRQLISQCVERNISTPQDILVQLGVY